MIKAQLIKTLLSIDEEAHLILGDMTPKPSIVLVGGAAFILRDLTMRQVTHDVDVLMVETCI
ncbi:MAG: hypothetical protein IKE43_10320 [Coriobacteriales bacterium]|nr:hypothetical protein [Coriobacteriales bacterium]